MGINVSRLETFCITISKCHKQSQMVGSIFQSWRSRHIREGNIFDFQYAQDIQHSSAIYTRIDFTYLQLTASIAI